MRGPTFGVGRPGKCVRAVEESRPAVSSNLPEQRPRVSDHPPRGADPPPRRRRSALLGGGVLVASSPVTVGAGLFVPGFIALGLGAVLLLLPPPAQRERKHRAPFRVLGRPAATAGRAAVALARGTAHTGTRTFRAVERFAATSGRDGALWIGRATFAGAGARGRTASTAGSHGWWAVRTGTPPAWRGLVARARWLARQARSASIRAWVRSRPVRRRAWAACLDALARAKREVAALSHSASEQLSSYVGSRTGR